MIKTGIVLNPEENRYEFLLAGFLVAHVERATYEVLTTEQKKEFAATVWAEVFKPADPELEEIEALSFG